MKCKKTPNKVMPKGKSGGGSYSVKGPKGAVKVTGKKKMPAAKKSTIQSKIEKAKF